MKFLNRIHFSIRTILLTVGLWVLAAGGFDKWKMMQWAMDKEHHGKSIGFSVKPVAIPIPLPIPIPIAMKEKAKGDTKAAPKPWKAESKDMFWKMMMMKMVMDKGKGDKGKGDSCCPQMVMMGGWPAMQKGGGDKAPKGSTMCCPSMQMNGGWPMMKSSMKKGSGSMMCCPQMMMNGGWSDGGMKACDMMTMMKGGWPMMMKGGWPPPPMCCPMNGGGGGWWPEEEEEEEPDYYEEEEPMTGWDTVNIPVMTLQDQLFFEKMRIKGDPVKQTTNSIKNNRDNLSNRREMGRYFFRKGARGLIYDFENDFD